jgi:hypothetical protein
MYFLFTYINKVVVYINNFNYYIYKICFWKKFIFILELFFFIKFKKIYF